MLVDFLSSTATMEDALKPQISLIAPSNLHSYKYFVDILAVFCLDYYQLTRVKLIDSPSTQSTFKFQYIFYSLIFFLKKVSKTLKKYFWNYMVKKMLFFERSQFF